MFVFCWARERLGKDSKLNIKKILKDNLHTKKKESALHGWIYLHSQVLLVSPVLGRLRKRIGSMSLAQDVQPVLGPPKL